MTELTFSIDETKLNDAISAAIMQQLDTAARERVIALAIKHIQSPPSYGGKSPLAQAFEAALRAKTHEIVGRILEEDAELRERVDDGVKAAVRGLLADSHRIRAAAAQALIDGALQVEREDEELDL